MQHHNGGNIFNAYTPPEKKKLHTNIKIMNQMEIYKG